MLLVAAAFAAPIHTESWYVQLASRVESEAGRHFATRPEVVQDTSATLLERGRLRAQRARDRGASEEKVQAYETFVADAAKNDLALYDPGDGRIHVLTDHFATFVRDTRVNAGVVRERAIRCVIGHELVHALQAEHSPRSGEPDLARLPLEEGQAQLVARRLCEEPMIWGFIEAIQGIDGLAARSPDDAIPYVYGYGQEYVTALAEKGGMEAVWQALEAPPPSKDEITATVAARLLPGWLDRALTEGPVRAAVPADWTVEASFANAYTLLPGTDGRLEGSLLAPVVRAGQSTVATGPTSVGQLRLGAMVMEEATHPRKWIEARRRVSRYFVAGQMSIPLFYNTYVFEHQAMHGLPRLVRTWALDDANCLRVWGDAVYEECWVARGRLLAVAVRRQFKEKAFDLGAVLEGLLAKDPATEVGER